MSDDLLKSKIELLEEQIENIEKSGFYTEKEMDSKVAPFRMELAVLKQTLAISQFSKSIHKYRFSFLEFQEAAEKFNLYLKQFEKPIEASLNDIHVINAKILTKNHQEA